MIRSITIPLLAITVSGCNLEALEGRPSEFQKHQESLKLVSHETPPDDTQQDLLLTAETQPECQGHVYRVHRCVDGKIMEWWYE